SCFGMQEIVSPQQRARHLQERLGELVEVEASLPQTIVHDRAIKGAAHHLDATHACPRKYWLEHVKGWVSEPFRFPNTKAAEVKTPSWPKATEFGLMMHRVVEIGLRNPLNLIAHHAPLDREWHHESEDEVLASSTTIARVMNEFGYGETQNEGTPEAKWRDRLMHIADLIDKGVLGQWVKGEHLHHYSVEAVRTELPFFHRHEIDTSSMPVSVFSPQGHTEQALVRQVNMDFSGRADLVLALADEEGRGALQVVDLKTQGCLQPFNEEDPTRGHGLQGTPPTTTSLEPIGPYERAILDEHRLQLTLYSMALEAIEQRKPEEHRRMILPPAILIGANGRMVQLTTEEFETSRTQLLEHLFWRSTLHLRPETEEPPRLSAGSAICEQCPFYRGDVRRCGPEGEPLGLQ
ncbi:MAG: PD-(D/E)XK nuclease family protein, partial [Candidatus Poseidonia sp.]|nr:PD-(D/E)XK nuclease family protein [Poseidonia sp.]